MEALDDIRARIAEHPENDWARSAGYAPLFAASPASRIVVVGQAPGRRAQEAGVCWHDASGTRLRSWLGVEQAVFDDPDCFAMLPMDFYYPGKGVSGDLPPRRGFAPLWHPPILERLGEVRLTLLVGGYAQAYYLGPRARASLTETVRSRRDYLPAVFPLPHPSPLNHGWRARNPWFEAEVVPELREAVAAALA